MKVIALSRKSQCFEQQVALQALVCKSNHSLLKPKVKRTTMNSVLMSRLYDQAPVT